MIHSTEVHAQTSFSLPTVHRGLGDVKNTNKHQPTHPVIYHLTNKLTWMARNLRRRNNAADVTAWVSAMNNTYNLLVVLSKDRAILKVEPHGERRKPGTLKRKIVRGKRTVGHWKRTASLSPPQRTPPVANNDNLLHTEDVSAIDEEVWLAKDLSEGKTYSPMDAEEPPTGPRNIGISQKNATTPALIAPTPFEWSCKLPTPPGIDSVVPHIDKTQDGRVLYTLKNKVEDTITEAKKKLSDGMQWLAGKLIQRIIAEKIQWEGHKPREFIKLLKDIADGMAYDGDPINKNFGFYVILSLQKHYDHFS